MGTGATSFRRLVSAFHDFSKKLSPEIRETRDYLKLLGHLLTFIHALFGRLYKKTFSFARPVDNFLIKCSIASLFQAAYPQKNIS